MPYAETPTDFTDEADSLVMTVPGSSHRERLDRVIAARFDTWSRSRLQRWIRDGAVLIDGQPVQNVSEKVAAGQVITVLPQPSDEMLAFKPEALDLDVVSVTDEYIILNKPVGMVVHPAAGNWHGTLLNGLLYHWPELAELPRAGIVHRLDKDTSGLLVVARRPGAQLALVRQLQARTVSRRYCAVCWGQAPTNGTVDAEIARDPRDKTRMTILEGGKPAITHFERLGYGEIGGKPVAVVMCSLETGRTHQIRVHLESIGLPLIGDQVYRRNAHRSHGLIDRQALHAARLAFDHPAGNGDLVVAHAPLPDDLASLVEHIMPVEAVHGRFGSI